MVRRGKLVPSIRSRWAAIPACALLAAPLAAAIAFVAHFASAMPLTDEWSFTKAIVALQGVDLHTRAGLAAAIDLFPARFGIHSVLVPFLYYWPIAEWSHFDSRWFIYTTVACFAVEALLFRRYMVRSTIWTVPIALILFCPSHYMEFMWGWQLTIAFSIVFPLAGLVAIDRIPVTGAAGAKIRCLVAGLALLLCGTLSSAGGFFGFPCSLLLVALKPFRRRDKVLWLGFLSVATTLAYLNLMHEQSFELSLGFRQAGLVLTALGGTVWGSPVGLFELGFDLLSVTGFLIAASTVAIVVRAAVVGGLPRIALPLCVIAFALMCALSIAMVREALGNWHLQFVLMAPCGAYAAGYLLWRQDKSRFSAIPFFTLVAVLTASTFSYFKGFSEFGPSYRADVQQIEEYARSYLVDPDVPKPHPPPWDVDPEMLLFLAAHDHPLFSNTDRSAPVIPLDANAHVFVAREEIKPPYAIEIARGRPLRLTVILPARAKARYVLAQIGDAVLVLRRISPKHTDIPGSAAQGVICYAGLVVPRLHSGGIHALRLSQCIWLK